ncbi:hypothetical protein T08_912 [Trichinella sp. T8]|nr:hypothetical protein T08_912 [Trichinella sp. T8]
MKQSASGDLLLWDVTLNFGETNSEQSGAPKQESVYGQAGKAASMELRRKAKRVEFSHI